LPVELHNAEPVRLLRGKRTAMTRGYRGLQGIRAVRATEAFSTLEGSKTPANEKLVPVRAVLVEQKDGFSGRTYARLGARCLDFHESDQAVHLRLPWSELREDAPDPQRILA